MFFEIKNNSDNSFTHSFNLRNNLWLNCDDGWRSELVGKIKIFVKGYVENHPIDISLLIDIINDPTPRFQGNYLAVIVYENDVVTITHDIHRSTPITISNNPFIITNLLLNNDAEKVWADRTISVNPDGSIIEHYFDPYGNIEIEPKTRDEVVNKLHQIIDNKFKNFLKHNKQPIKVFLSGGVDTLTLFSYLKKHTDNYELCNYEHIDFTKFYCNKKNYFDQYWGYKQIHLWKDSCILLTGANGDENLIRSPATIILLLTHWEIELHDIIFSDHYHYKYLTADKLKSVYQTQKKKYSDITKNYQELTKQILNINLHDHQHWHLDNTLTLTPFKDLELCKLMLSLPKDDLLDQILDAGISKQLIALNDESLLEGLSSQKNSNSQEHLYKIYSKYC